MFHKSLEAKINDSSKYQEKSKNWKNYNPEYHNKKEGDRPTLPVSRPTDKYCKKLVDNNFTQRSNTSMFVKQSENPIQTLDFTLNLNGHKKNSKYINAYFTETDFSRRKMFHESKMLDSAPPVTRQSNFKPEFLKNNNCNSSDDLTFHDGSIKNNGKSIRMKKIGNDIEEFFTERSCGFKEYYCKDNLIQYYCRRKRCHKKISQEYSCYPVDKIKERTLLSSPDINILYNAHDKFKKEKETNDSNFSYSNIIDLKSINVNTSISTMRLRKKIFTENESKTKTKPTETVLKSRTFTKFEDYFRNNKVLNETKIKFTKDKTLSDRLGVNMSLYFYENNCHNNMANVQSKQMRSDKYNYDIIMKNQENLVNDKVRFVGTQMSGDFTDSQSNETDCDCINDLSDSSLLDYSISKRQQFIGKSILKNSSKISNCTEINYNIANSKNKNFLSKSLGECCLNELYNTKEGKFNNNDVLLYLTSEGYRCKRHENTSFYDFDNFDSKFRNYLLDRSLKEYYLRRKFSPTLNHPEEEHNAIKNNYCNNCTKIGNPITFEEDILVKNLSNMYNYHSPLLFKLDDCIMAKKSHTFFDSIEEDVIESNNNNTLNFDGNYLSKIKTDNIPLNKTIPDNLFVVEGKEATKNKESNIKKPAIDFSQGKSVTNNQFDDIYSKKTGLFQFAIMNENMIFNRVFNETLHENRDVVQKLCDDNLGKNSRKNNKSIEVIFPVKSKRIRCCSYKTLTDVTGLSDATYNLVTFNETKKNMKANNDFNFSIREKTKIIDSNQEIQVDDLKYKKLDGLFNKKVTDPTENENTEFFHDKKEKNPMQNNKVILTNKKIDSNTEMNDKTLLSSLSIKVLKSNQFKQEVEDVVKNYLQNNAVVNCMNNDNFNVILIPKNYATMDISQRIINSFQINQEQMLRELLKSLIFCNSCNNKIINLLPKNDKSVNLNLNFSRNINSNCSVEQDSLSSKGQSKNKLHKNESVSLNKIRSFPIFNVSSLKIKTKSVISCHCKNKSKQFNRSKSKAISKTSFHKSNATVIRGTFDENKFLNNETDDKDKFLMDETQIIRKLDLFNDFLIEIERKQDTIISILSQDPCGLLFKLSQTPSVMLVKKSKFSGHNPKLKSKVKS